MSTARLPGLRTAGGPFPFRDIGDDAPARRKARDMLRLLFPLFAAAPIAGCGLILDFDPPDPTTVAVVDAGTFDARVDIGDADIGMADAAPDAALRRDGGPDASADGGLRDAMADAGEPDAGDPDAGGDAGPPEGCADGTIDQTYAASSDMVGCDGAATQCEAEALCAPGWHLCSPAAYRVRGGSDTPATAGRWLAGCLRSACGSEPIGPGTAICTSCAAGIGTALELSFTCDAAERARPEVACNVGAAASADPWHLVSRSLECLMASAEPAQTLLGATCCR